MDSAGPISAWFYTALRRLTGGTALASLRARAIDRRYAFYVQKLREMFESGDIDAALRHAIPLAAEAGPRRPSPRPLALHPDLSIRPERSRPWPATKISPDLYGELRRLYRDAFHRLEAQARIEEAAFLLAEVLHAHEEAVAFLERHGRLRLAAEIAEARGLPAGLVVRQWFLAGDLQRGVRIARRTGAFGDAVSRLERSRKTEEAAELRRLWAQELAGAGNHAAADAVLRLAPPRAARAPWSPGRENRRFEIAAQDVGIMPVHDAAFLPNGLTAVALGEAGVRLLSRAGRIVAELDQPAHRLVVSGHGDRAIALARRGAAWRLARLDFRSRQAESWCEAQLEAFAPDYDGALWFVGGLDGIVAIDTAAARFDGPWSVSRLPGRALAIARSSGRCSVAFDGEGHEVWTYELPSLTLRRRESVLPAPGYDRSRLVALSPEGTLAEASSGSGRRIALHVYGTSCCEVPLAGSGTPEEPSIAGDWAALPVLTSEAILVHLIHLPSASVRGEIVLEGAAQVALRLTSRDLTLADDRGRVMALDLERGQVRRDFRV